MPHLVETDLVETDAADARQLVGDRLIAASARAVSLLSSAVDAKA